MISIGKIIHHDQCCLIDIFCVPRRKRTRNMERIISCCIVVILCIVGKNKFKLFLYLCCWNDRYQHTFNWILVNLRWLAQLLTPRGNARSWIPVQFIRIWTSNSIDQNTIMLGVWLSMGRLLWSNKRNRNYECRFSDQYNIWIFCKCTMKTQ